MLVYCIDKELSQQEKACVICAGMGTVDGFTLTAFKENPTLKVIVSYAKSFQTIQSLAASHKLFFQKRQLVVDPFNRIPVYFRITPTENGLLCISGQIKTAKGDIDVYECDFLCGKSPQWFIKGLSLCALDGEIPSGFSPRTMTPEQVLDLLYDAGEPIGTLQFEGNAAEILQQSQQPTPILMLQDRTGAFANLWMDYGCGRRVALHELHEPGCKRQKEAERLWEKDLLETDFVRKISGTSHYYCPVDK